MPTYQKKTHHGSQKTKKHIRTPYLRRGPHFRSPLPLGGLGDSERLVEAGLAHGQLHRPCVSSGCAAAAVASETCSRPPLRTPLLLVAGQGCQHSALDACPVLKPAQVAMHWSSDKARCWKRFSTSIDRVLQLCPLAKTVLCTVKGSGGLGVVTKALPAFATSPQQYCKSWGGVPDSSLP